MICIELQLEKVCCWCGTIDVWVVKGATTTNLGLGSEAKGATNRGRRIGEGSAEVLLGGLRGALISEVAKDVF